MAKKTARLMKLNRNYNHTSLMGHSIRFVKDKPTSVPPLLYAEILAIGGEFVDGEGLAVAAEDGSREPIDPVERDARIDDAIEVIVGRNDVDDFTAANTPKADAVSREVGFKVTAKETAKAWQRRADRIADEKLSG